MRNGSLVKSLIALSVICLLAGFAAPETVMAADKNPLGVVDSQRIAEEYEAARDAYDQYQLFLRELELEVVEKEKTLTIMAEELESQKMLLGSEALATKAQQFEQKRAEYFQFRESLEKKAEEEYKAKITPLLDQVKTIVERIGKEKGYGLVVDSASLAVLYIDPDFDLTNDVLAALVKGDD
jgi:outer membrane protein